MPKIKKEKNPATLRTTLDRAANNEAKIRKILAGWLFERYDLLLSENKLDQFVQNIQDETPVYVGEWSPEEGTSAYLTLKEAGLRSEPESHFLYFAIVENVPTTLWELSPLPKNESLNNFTMKSHQMNVIRQLVREEYVTDFRKSKIKPQVGSEVTV